MFGAIQTIKHLVQLYKSPSSKRTTNKVGLVTSPFTPIADAVATLKQKVPKKPRKAKSFVKKPPGLPWRVIASKAKLTLLSPPQDSVVMTRILFDHHAQ